MPQTTSITPQQGSQPNGMMLVLDMLSRIARGGRTAQAQQTQRRPMGGYYVQGPFGLSSGGSDVEARRRASYSSGGRSRRAERNAASRANTIARNEERRKERLHRDAMREADQIIQDTQADQQIASRLQEQKHGEKVMAEREKFYGKQPAPQPLDALTLLGGANRDVRPPVDRGPQMQQYDLPLGPDRVAERYAAEDAAKARQLEAMYNDYSPDGMNRPQAPAPLEDPYGIRAEYARQQQELPYQTSQVGPGPVGTNSEGLPIFDTDELRAYMGTPPDENARVADLMRQRMTEMEQRGTNLNELVGVDPTLSPGMAGYLSPRTRDNRLFDYYNNEMRPHAQRRGYATVNQPGFTLEDFPGAQAYPGSPDTRTAGEMAPQAPPITARDRFEMGVPMDRSNPLMQFFYGPIQPPTQVGPGLVRQGRYAIPMGEHPYFQQGMMPTGLRGY